jgi:hypothetical protein
MRAWEVSNGCEGFSFLHYIVLSNTEERAIEIGRVNFLSEGQSSKHITAKVLFSNVNEEACSCLYE